MGARIAGIGHQLCNWATFHSIGRPAGRVWICLHDVSSLTRQLNGCKIDIIGQNCAGVRLAFTKEPRAMLSFGIRLCRASEGIKGGLRHLLDLATAINPIFEPAKIVDFPIPQVFKGFTAKRRTSTRGTMEDDRTILS